MGKIRLIVQIIVTVVTNGYIKGFTEGGVYKENTKTACVPGLNCYSCPGALGSCPIGAFQSLVNEKNITIPFYVIGFLFAVGALLGRFVCGWLCPFGLLQDLLNKIPFKKKIKVVPGDKYLKSLKFIILILFVIILPMFVLDDYGRGKPWFCEFICPAGTFMAGWPLVILNEGLRSVLGILFAWKSLILIVLIVASIFIYRPFCRYMCPLGLIYGGCNKFSLYRFSIDGEKCIKCGKCSEVCKLNIKTYKTPNSIECIRCGDCIKACPQNAIKRGGLK